MRVIVTPMRRMHGGLMPPGDKSISHRAALLGALAHGTTEIHGFLEADDCLDTLKALGALGIEWSRKAAGHYLILGAGQVGLREPEAILDCGNSGTTCRLLLGVLAGQPFSACLTGDASLRRRPMGRVTEPLSQMGARVIGREGARFLPLAIEGRRPLRAIRYRMPVASAQVKSALLLAGLFAHGPVVVEEPAPSRDHTERMLREFGARISVNHLVVAVEPEPRLEGRFLAIPGDFSSAAFFLVAGALMPEGEITVSRVGVNPTRTGCLDLLRAMGADIAIRNGEEAWEPQAEITVRSSTLRGLTVGGEMIPRVIDEIPILAVAMARAHGVSEIRDGAELRVKESDRIRALATELSKLGAKIEEREDGLRIEGDRLRGGVVSSWGDHRMAMALVVAGLVAEGETVIEGAECITVSYPDFLSTLQGLAGRQCIRVEARG